MKDSTVKELILNKPQKRFVLQQPFEATNIWSRGTGKSFIIAWLLRLIVETMPRSAWIIQGQSYKQIMTRTLPGTLSALEYFGYVYERDYYVRRKPPASKNFKRPYEAPLDYDHFIIFKNGTGFHLASQDPGGGSVRGLNSDGIISDETLLLDHAKFTAEAFATNRGKERYFSHVPYHHGVFHFSSMPYGKQGAWLFDSAKYYKEEGYYKETGLDFRVLRNEIINLQVKFIANKDLAYRVKLWEEIRLLKLKLRFYKSKAGLFYSEADAFDNLHNLGIRYLEQQYRDLPDFIFLTEILNKRIESIEGGFYPYLSRAKHCYVDGFDNSYITNLEYGDEKLLSEDCRFDHDLVKGQALRLAVDWGSKINSLTVTQFIRSLNELRFLKNIYVKHPLILDDLAKEFCRYYEYHNDKTVFLSYDHTGNTQMANSNITYAEQFAAILKKNGWTVHMAPPEAPPTHAEKYLLWNKILKEDDPNLPRVRFNAHNCKEVIISMEQAPAKETLKGIEKDKSSERSNIPQEEATHLSDTADMHVDVLFKHFLEYSPAFIDNLFSGRR